MPEMTEAYDWHGRTILDAHGERIGKIDQVYLNPETDVAEWALVDRGLLCRRSTFVPIRSAGPTGEDVQVEVSKEQVKTAPVMEGDAALSPAEEAELLRHYGLGGDPAPSSDGAMTRSEEELHVSTVWRPRTRVRLRKYVVTEMVTKTVPVRREEVRLEYEAITDADGASASVEPTPSDESHEVVLHEERLVIEKRVVATERVRIGKRTTTATQTITDEVRKERVDV